MPEVSRIIKEDLAKVELKLSEQLTGSYLEEQINKMCLRVVNAGGKRIRPRLCILSRRALGDLVTLDDDCLYSLSAAIELLHTATLVHDDVIDKATVRRGVSTLNETDGNHAAVLAGDYLFTRTFMCLQNLSNNALFPIVSQTLATLVRGEINQFHNQGNIDITIADYEETIYCKTGALFEFATTAAAIEAKADEKYIRALSEYGKQLGIAFQVADDMLDYTSSTDLLGKSIGEDLTDGRVTLPLILSLKHCPQDRLDELKDAIYNDRLDTVIEFIKLTESLKFCSEFALNAARKAQEALKVLPDNQFTQTLAALAYEAVNRSK